MIEKAIELLSPEMKRSLYVGMIANIEWQINRVRLDVERCDGEDKDRLESWLTTALELRDHLYRQLSIALGDAETCENENT
jgi:hypothetical protein